MTFQNPWGLLALLAVPALIALYILKQKHQDLKVPSLLLWKKTQSMMEAATPWQRLRRNLLFFLQLLAVLFLALAIAGPAIESQNVYDEITVVIDASASMQATDTGKTRYETALAECRTLAEGLRRGQKMSVIFAGETVFPAVSHSESKYEIKEALNSYSGCLYGSADLDTALLLAESMRSDAGNNEILVFTDFYAESEKEYIHYRDFSESRDNTAVLHLSVGNTGNSLMAMSSVETFGGDKEVTLELLADNVLCDAKKVTLRGGTAENVYWQNIPDTATDVTVRLSEHDFLTADDSLTASVRNRQKKKILIVSDNGFFWEKALSAVSSDEIYNITPQNYTDTSAEGYDLCLFENFTPASLPENAVCWLVHPVTDIVGITAGEQIKGTSLTAATGTVAEELTAYVNPAAVLLSAFTELSADASWQPVLLCGTYPVVAVRTAGEQKTAVFAFDIHNSNLPLLKDFPILIRNLLSWSLPEMLEGDGTVTAGTVVTVRPLTYATETRVKYPDSHTETLKNSTFTATIPGYYTVTQTLSRKQGETVTQSEACSGIYAQIPAAESAMGGQNTKDAEGRTAILRGQLALRPYLCIAVLVLLLGEWWVYQHENQL